MTTAELAPAIDEAAWARAVELLGQAEEVALACHVDPDGDALGSMLALMLVLERRGVRVTASWGSPRVADVDPALLVPPQYTFLPGLTRLCPASSFPSAPPLLVAFDCGSPDRLGSLAAPATGAGTVIVLDHHASGVAFGDVQLIDGGAAATAVLVDELLRRMGEPLDRDVATCLYVALVTDTGRFSYASTTPAVMELGARLIAHDIDHAAINRQVWETHSFGYLKVLARALQRAVFVPEASLTWTAVRQADLADLGIDAAEMEGLIDVLRAVEAAECALVCKEQPDGTWKTSLRSKGRVDVGRVAAGFGGGGHAFAGGFTTSLPLEELVDGVVAALVDAPAAAVAGERR